MKILLGLLTLLLITGCVGVGVVGPIDTAPEVAKAPQSLINECTKKCVQVTEMPLNCEDQCNMAGDLGERETRKMIELYGSMIVEQPPSPELDEPVQEIQDLPDTFDSISESPQDLIDKCIRVCEEDANIPSKCEQRCEDAHEYGGTEGVNKMLEIYGVQIQEPGSSPEEVLAYMEEQKAYLDSQPVEKCLPEQSPVSVLSLFEEHFITGELTRLHIEGMTFKGYDYNADYYEYKDCRDAILEGENTNYLYCDDITVKFSDNSGVIVDTVELKLGFHKYDDQAKIAISCSPY